MRFPLAALWIALAHWPPAMCAQATQPSMKLGLGSPKTMVQSTFGSPFERWRLQDSEDSAKVGAPLGEWMVYHLTAAGERMYVTMVHFSPSENDQKIPSKSTVDALMLMLNGQWSVDQIMQDHPEFAVLCFHRCAMERMVNASGNTSLLLLPGNAGSDGPILYFDGDSSTIQWKDVSSPQSIASWVYAAPKAQFESHHRNAKYEMIGTWNPR